MFLGVAVTDKIVDPRYGTGSNIIMVDCNQMKSALLLYLNNRMGATTSFNMDSADCQSVKLSGNGDLAGDFTGYNLLYFRYKCGFPTKTPTPSPTAAAPRAEEEEKSSSSTVIIIVIVIAVLVCTCLYHIGARERRKAAKRAPEELELEQVKHSMII